MKHTKKVHKQNQTLNKYEKNTQCRSIMRLHWVNASSAFNDFNVQKT